METGLRLPFRRSRAIGIPPQRVAMVAKNQGRLLELAASIARVTPAGHNRATATV